ncbi:zeta toxin family protein [Sinomonas humi]|uniref:zeta toxin family protein n=1 Tax=Sinomonas humi TaxID=1338436 RepID=UPI00068EA0A0|nr:zeta toxin family protein [Sinomonas humi]
MGGDREAVFAALEDLYRPEGGLYVAPRELAEHFDDAMIAHLVREYLDLQGEVVAEGKAVVVSAGPPGAGKSGALGSLDLRGYRVIDPDAAKDILIRHALDAGLLDYRLGFGLPDGDSVHPLELAPHIHSQSTRLTDLVRQICLDAGENIVIDGTLAWHRLPEVYIGELYRAGYENLDVVSIELPLEVASARVRDRWWVGRERARGQTVSTGSWAVASSPKRASDAATPPRTPNPSAPPTPASLPSVPRTNSAGERFTGSLSWTRIPRRFPREIPGFGTIAGLSSRGEEATACGPPAGFSRRNGTADGPDSGLGRPVPRNGPLGTAMTGPDRPTRHAGRWNDRHPRLVRGLLSSTIRPTRESGSDDYRGEGQG